MSSPRESVHTPSRQSEKFAYALAQFQRGKLDESEAACRHILKIHPRNFDAAHLLGIIQLRRMRPDLAERQLQFAIRIDPNIAMAYNSRGIALKELGRLEEALACFEEAVELEPRYLEALVNRGAALHALGRFEEAVASYDQAIAFRPDFAAAFSNRGNAFKELKRRDEAIASHDRAVALDPNSASAFNNRGHTLYHFKAFDRALESYNRAIALDRDYAEAHYNRGLLLHEVGQYEDALASYGRAIACRPEYPNAYFDRALSLLTLGRFGQGWEDFEHRWRLPSFGTRTDIDRGKLALWFRKEDLRNKRLLLVAEQGVGDEIMFASMISDLARDARSVALECDPRLAELLARSFPDIEIVHRGSLPRSRLDAFDHLLPIGSLGRLYRRSRGEFPDRASYLKPDTAVVSRWRGQLAELGPGLKVGISWRGGTDTTRREARSIPLKLLHPLFAVDGARFISLQYGEVAGEIQAANEDLPRPIAQFAPEDLRDFDQTAALVKALDLVISVQTALVHLSGAVGHSCWVLVPHAAEWRYGVQESAMPWYASVKLYRQRAHGEWGETIARVAADLRAAIGGAAQLACLEQVGKTG